MGSLNSSSVGLNTGHSRRPLIDPFVSAARRPPLRRMAAPSVRAAATALLCARSETVARLLAFCRCVKGLAQVLSGGFRLP